MEHACPYEGCKGVIKTKSWAALESDLKCPECHRPVEVEHECYVTEEGDCMEWLYKSDKVK